MKKVVKGEELLTKMAEAVNLLCDTVKATIGPKGNNVIIDHSAFSPFITNDGVTIAQNIESEDAVVNTILELAKEASVKTNEMVGDGTTTTLVLLQSLFNEGFKLIKEGYNPLVLQKELTESLNQVLPLITSESWSARCQDLVKIASISAGSEQIGKNLIEAYLKVRNKEAISITEGSSESDEVIHKQGYVIETMLASPYFLKDQKEIDLVNVPILIINDYVSSLETIAPILNNLNSEKTILILALDYDETLVNNILKMTLDQTLNCLLLKIPGYGDEKLTILNDLSLISNAVICDTSNVTYDNLGVVNSININEKETIFTFYKNNKIKDTIWHNINENKRQAMLENGLIEIKVGALTMTERREKKMRYIDAYHAIFASLSGIVLGGGLTYLKVSEKMITKTNGDKIMQKSLKAPFEQILINAALDSEKIFAQLKQNNFQKVYDVNKNVWEDKDLTSVLDPLDVITQALKNAVSIAGMLFTTTSLIINEYPNNLNKENNYNDL